jgi:type II secretory pathway component PulC
MKRMLLPSAVVLVATIGVAFAAEKTKPLKSGLQKGDFADAFNVRDITGPAKGTTLCYR